MEHHWDIPEVHRGRQPTPIGDDSIAPWIRIPHDQAIIILGMLQLRDIPHEVRQDGGLVGSDSNIIVPYDRVSFPGGNHHRLQEMFDRWRPWHV